MNEPRFAVVGHPNKGKSSVVATLAENSDIAIGHVPGTTARANEYAFQVNGRLLYSLIDTPGFQRAGALFRWLQEREGDASERPALIRQFVEEHIDDPRFVDECELLKPVIAGAGILYVVDGSKPYGSEFELEMQILQWTGQPRMALINLIGDGDFVDQWRAALGQHFSIVRVFDAQLADFDARLQLLSAFAELSQEWREPIEAAISALRDERERRMDLAAHRITTALIAMLTAVERAEFEQGVDKDQLGERLVSDLRANLRKLEVRCRRDVQDLYHHDGVRYEQAPIPVVEGDLFAEEGWELFGLSRENLLITGALSGAVAGGGVDLLLGGSSLFLGTAIGGIVGGAGAYFGSEELAKVKVLGQSLGGDILQAGPVQSANFPWVLLGRAWLHFRLVSERNHARREAIVAANPDSAMMDQLPSELRNELARSFGRIRAGRLDAEGQSRFVTAIKNVLAREV